MAQEGHVDDTSPDCRGSPTAPPRRPVPDGLACTAVERIEAPSEGREKQMTISDGRRKLEERPTMECPEAAERRSESNGSVEPLSRAVEAEGRPVDAFGWTCVRARRL